MLWKKKPTIDQLNQRCRDTLVSHLGMIFTEVGDDYLVAKMPVDKRTVQPAGLLHGGASVALAESLGSVASALCLEADDQMPVGVEINANHIKSARTGWVTGKVTGLQIGKRIHVWEIKIENEASELVCASRLTVMIVSKK